MVTEQLIHSGKFEDYNNNEITVSFYKKSEEQLETSENDLKFSGVEPVVINRNGSVNDIYAPVKTTSCDVNIVSEKILDDLYSPNKNEVYMKVERKSPKRVKQIVCTDSGGVVSSYVDYALPPVSGYEHNLNVENSVYNDMFDTGYFMDINGVFYAHGYFYKHSDNTIEYIGNEIYVLRYIPSTGAWVRDNPWHIFDTLEQNSTILEQYFYVGENSYKANYNSNLVYEWDGANWGPNKALYKVEDGTSSLCGIPVDYVIHYIDNSTEMVYQNKRYTWDSTNMRWVKTSTYEYTDLEGTFNAPFIGNKIPSHMKVRNKLGYLVDATVCDGYDEDNEYHMYIMMMDKTNNALTKLIEVPYSDTVNEVFTDDDGYVYYLDSTNCDIYYWSWESMTWKEWVSFTGDCNSMSIEYIIPIAPKKVMLKYLDSNDDSHFICLTDFVHPTYTIEYIIVPGQYNYETLFEGYKIANTYSQDVTQNLDEINMTCIDPVALLKYVTIDKIYEKPAMKSYGEILGKALAYVMLSGNRLFVERNVTYGSSTHTTTNNILNMMCQISNFWDEGDEPATIYEVIEEMLRPFCLTLQYINGRFTIFNQSRTSDSSLFDLYYIDDDGALSNAGSQEVDVEDYVFNNMDWKSNNTETATIEIGSTYNSVYAIASTSVPKYSSMVTDKVNYNDRDKYDIAQLNVQRNKSKGYRYYTTPGSIIPALHLDDTDYWFYLWNGVYTDEDYELISYSNIVNGWLNINAAHEYVTGHTEYPADTGSILNFYGGGNNPTATGKTQETEKPVDVKSRITAYASDNGVPPELLESADLWWSFESNYVDNEGTDQFNPQLHKTGIDSRFGSDISTHYDMVSYHQKYENTVLNGLNSQQTVKIQLTQSYSRTGINVPINILNNDKDNSNLFILKNDPSYSEEYYRPIIYTSTVNYFPYLWNWDNVKVNDMYFHRYTTGHNNRITEVWDKRRVDLYIDLGGNNGILHFNGKEWVEEATLNTSNSFYLMKLMNYEQLYHTDHTYNVIETADYDPNNPSAGGHYSLNDDNFSYMVDQYGGVVENATSYNRFCPPYRGETNEWSQWIAECGDGNLAIVLPTIESGVADVVIDIYSSSLLGTTGGSTIFSTQAVPVYYKYEGTGRIGADQEVTLSEQNIGPLYGNIGICPDNGASIDFVPANVSYVKGEHLDLSITMDVPESNLGQMFSQSDIKYLIDKQNDYDEKYQMPDFKMNTYNQLVNDSFSYIIFDGMRADPDEFVINGLAVRPECYTVQAYMNWLSTIRKSYNKTILPLKYGKIFSNFKTFITSPEVGTNKLLVVSDTWDVKSDRHSIAAIEANGLDVNTVSSYSVFELPRKARNERWNLPTAKK